MYNPKKSSSARVVFDCAAVFHNKSLNACLIQGPDLLNSLISVLCQFREHPIALMGDIEKMFYRFKVKKEHRDYLRFLWWKDSDMTLPPIDCRMTVHIFGAVSSPCCANFALKRLANDNKNKFSCETIKFIQNQFYVDHGLYSAQTVPEAIKIVNEARDLSKLGQLRLHKFVSNSRQLMALIHCV